MRLFLIILMTMPSLLLCGQPKDSMINQEEKADTFQSDDHFKQIDGRLAPEPVSSYLYSNSNRLSFNDIAPIDQPKVIYRNNTPIFIEKIKSPLKLGKNLPPDEQFYSFLEESKAITKVNSPRESFKISGIHSDNLGISHIKSVQQYKGIEIYGSESILHIDPEKERFTGSFCYIDQDIAEKPVIDSIQAIQIIITDLKQMTVFRELTPGEKKLLNYQSPYCSLVWYDTGHNNYKLTWSVSLRPNLIEEWKYFLDAQTGKIIHKFNNTKSDGPALGTGLDLNGLTRTFDVYLLGDIYYLYNITESMYNPVTSEGIIVTLDANYTSTFVLDFSYVTSPNNTWTQQAAISAHCNAAKTYEYFDTTFNWRSVNGKGGNIVSLVNIAEEDGSSMENAFWNGQAVFYGNGGDYFKPLAGALDVTAHEFGHGVVSSSANLEYYGQPGAINESFADIFACMVDRNDWQIGEDITKEGYSPSGAVRDLSDPHNMGDSTKAYWQPAHASEMYLGTKDNGGVHLNSGLINHAYYHYAISIGKKKAEQVFFRALTEYLTKNSGFIDLRIAVTQSARDLYGENKSEVLEAKRVFELVGIHEEELINESPVYQTNPGTEFLLSYDTNPSDPVSLYLSSSQGTDYHALTNTPMKGKASVTDDGTKAVFVSNDHRLRMISLNQENPEEKVISGYSYYDNVAISKDGKRIAANKVYSDASIYVIDLESGEGRRFILYNPTTGNSGIDAGGVVKADAMEFDITGEYLIYDSYNVINSNSQKDIYYWNIGFIKVWDNHCNCFGDGTISKLFNSLPANVSVANPVFSSNSPFIVAFDYSFDDDIIEKHSIYAANIETGEMKQLITNDRLGFPSFSKNDDRIAYSTINEQNMQVVKAIKLRNDKITPTGYPGVLVPDAKWPVFFANGIRSLGLAPVANFTADYRSGGLPLKIRFMDLSGNKPSSWLWSFEGGTPDTSTLQNPDISFKISGTYKVTLKVTNSFGTNTITKQGYIHAYDPTGINDSHVNEVLFYPNPVEDLLTIDFDQDYTVKIFNLQGELVYNGANESRIDASNLHAGVYILQLNTKQGLYRSKLLKK
jgi:bacillolysin